MSDKEQQSRKVEGSQAESIRQGLQEAIDYADGEHYKAIVNSHQPFLQVNSGEKKSYVAEWLVVLSITATCLLLLATIRYGINTSVAVNAAIGIAAGFVYLLTLYTGRHFGMEEGKEIAWQVAAAAMKKMLGEVKSEIAAKEMQS
jgi:hypothetical protein